MNIYTLPPPHAKCIYCPKAQCDGIWGGSFGRKLDHKGKALMNEISAFIKSEVREIITLPLQCQETARKWQCASKDEGPHRTPHAGPLISDI